MSHDQATGELISIGATILTRGVSYVFPNGKVVGGYAAREIERLYLEIERLRVIVAHFADQAGMTPDELKRRHDV